MGFARKVANRMIFMDEGQIVEQNEPKAFLKTTKRLHQLFLKRSVALAILV